MPSHPRITLALYLTDPAEFYARQRQRSLWVGGMILVATAATLVGSMRARRALNREHQLNVLKTNFVSSVSHELRAPIASLRLMAESLDRGKVPDPARQSEYFRFMVQECRRLSALIANVLDYSRIEQGRKGYVFEPTDVVALVHDTVKLMQLYAGDRGVTLLSEASSATEPGNGLQPKLDGGAIQQALVNLIDNAVKHSPKGAAVKVGLEWLVLNGTGRSEIDPPSGRSKGLPVPESLPVLRLWVDDTGPGIAAAEQERIFERFYRIGSELRRETEGVGIGLSIVKHIVAAHQGRVIVQSELGQGSRFIIELPIQATPNSP